MGADAVVGVDLEININGDNMFIASANGTAVKLRKQEIYENRRR